MQHIKILSDHNISTNTTEYLRVEVYYFKASFATECTTLPLFFKDNSTISREFSFVSRLGFDAYYGGCVQVPKQRWHVIWAMYCMFESMNEILQINFILEMFCIFIGSIKNTMLLSGRVSKTHWIKQKGPVLDIPHASLKSSGNSKWGKYVSTSYNDFLALRSSIECNFGDFML